MEEVITSRSNARIKWARAVREGQHADLVWAEGPRLLQDALASGWQVELLLLQVRSAADAPRALSGWQGEIRHLPTLRINPDVMACLADTVTSQGCAAVLRRPPEVVLEPGLKRFLVLDRVQDPGNVGTLLRSAEAAGVQAVLLLEGCADPFGPKALRASMGAALRLPLRQNLTWAQAKALLPKQTCRLAACMQGHQDHDALPWPGHWALVLGHEGQGVDAAILADCPVRVAVAMEGRVESLNVAAAGAVLMFEAARQRRRQTHQQA